MRSDRDRVDTAARRFQLIYTVQRLQIPHLNTPSRLQVHYRYTQGTLSHTNCHRAFPADVHSPASPDPTPRHTHHTRTPMVHTGTPRVHSVTHTAAGRFQLIYTVQHLQIPHLNTPSRPRYTTRTLRVHSVTHTAVRRLQLMYTVQHLQIPHLNTPSRLLVHYRYTQGTSRVHSFTHTAARHLQLMYIIQR